MVGKAHVRAPAQLDQSLLGLPAHRVHAPGAAVSVSSDGNKVVFVQGDQGERSPVWVAALDGSTSLRALASIDGVIAYFSTPGSVIFAGREGAFGFLYRIREDGGGLEKLASSSILYLYGISPDQKWIAAWVPGSTPETRNPVLAIPVQGGAPVLICGNCGGAGAQRRGHTPPAVSWSQDQEFFYLNVRPRFALYAIPLRGGNALPPIPASGIRSVTDVEAIPSALNFVFEINDATPTELARRFPKRSRKISATVLGGLSGSMRLSRRRPSRFWAY